VVSRRVWLMGVVVLVFFLGGRRFWCLSAVTRATSWEVGHGTSDTHAWE
jgi:GTP-dependent phosphoenolpyruvate carboxykinase